MKATLIALRRLAGAALLAGCLLGPVTLAGAQEEIDPAEERAETFEAATGAQTENVPGGMLMVTAYGAIFILVLGYVVTLAMRQRRIQGELARLKEDLETYARQNPSGDLPPEEF